MNYWSMLYIYVTSYGELMSYLGKEIIMNEVQL